MPTSCTSVARLSATFAGVVKWSAALGSRRVVAWSLFTVGIAEVSACAVSIPVQFHDRLCPSQHRQGFPCGTCLVPLSNQIQGSSWRAKCSSFKQVPMIRIQMPPNMNDLFGSLVPRRVCRDNKQPEEATRTCTGPDLRAGCLQPETAIFWCPFLKGYSRSLDGSRFF